MNPSLLTVYTSPFPKIRLGKEYDGGYVFADIPHIQYTMLLAGGIESDISFELDFVKKYPDVQVYAYDGTIGQLPQIHPNIHFIKKNIGNVENDRETHLHDMIQSHESIFVKMDIEGGEIPWLESLTLTQLDSFEQIVMEFHFPFSHGHIFEKLNQTHYLIHFHGNNCCGLRNHQNVHIPNIFECTYLHKKYFTQPPSFNRIGIPSELDMPNISTRKDIVIQHVPFVHKD